MTEQQWMTIYRETIQPLFGYMARRTGGNRALSEDIVQEAYLRALEDWKRKIVPDSPLAWLKRVALRILIDYVRRSKGESLAASGPGADPADPASADQIRSLELVLALSSLGRKKAGILEAFYFDGLSVREIADEMAISERAVEGLLRRARRSLKTRLPESKANGGYHE